METCKCIYQSDETNLEIISECVISEDLKLLKEKFVEHYLKLEHVDSSVTYYKNKCLTIYTNMGERIYLSKTKYFSLLKELNKFENNYIYLTHNPHLVKYIKDVLTKYEDQILENNMYLYTHKDNKELIQTVRKLSPYIHHSNCAEEVEKILHLKTIAPEFFEIKDWKMKENVQNIEKGIIPVYRSNSNDKLDLLNAIRNEGNLHLTHTDISNLIRNNDIPYMDYKDLQNVLKKLDQKKTHSVNIFDSLESAFLHCLCLSKEKIKFIMCNEDKHYIIFSECELKQNHPNPESYMPLQEEEYSFENKIIYHLFKEKPENIINKQVPFVVDNKVKSIDYFNMLNNYIVENNNPDFDIILAAHPHTRKEKILNKFINIEITYTSTNLAEIYVIYNRKSILLVKNFYLPKEMEDLFKPSIRLLWNNGYLLNDYGYNYYVKHGKILTKTIYAPWWLQSTNNKELKNLIKFINQLKDVN